MEENIKIFNKEEIKILIAGLEEVNKQGQSLDASAKLLDLRLKLKGLDS